MPHLWLTQNQRWQPVPLAGPALALSSDGLRPIESFDPAPVWLRAIGAREWVLLAVPGAVSLNGAPLRCGVHVLRDRDELRLSGGERAYFSTERLAAAQLHESEAALCCPRCRMAIERGTLVVACPACGATCHQNADRECWTYAATCPLCSQPSALDAGYRWTPEEL